MKYIGRSHTKLLVIIILIIGVCAVSYLITNKFFARRAHQAGTISSCDLNNDSLCDIHDIQIIHDAMGTCASDDRYRVEFDINGDGCLTKEGDLDELMARYYRVLDKSKIPTPAHQEYKEACDYDKDLDCDQQDTILYQKIVDEQSILDRIVAAIAAYHKNQEEYPETLSELIPEYFAEIPVLPGTTYAAEKGRREYSLCYRTITTNPPSTRCVRN